MTLFTKEGCRKCDYLKKKVDLAAFGIQVEELGPDNPDALAHLAWHELISVAEKQLPILVLDDSSYIADVIPILRYLKRIQKGGTVC
jgi:glutaredoxin 2